MAEEYPKTITLPQSGKTLIVQRLAKGRDLRIGARAAGKKADPLQRAYGILAQIVLLDGQPVIMEDIDDWFADDINAAMRAAGLTRGEDEEDEDEKNSQTRPA
jgi:hypothetical protein